MRLAEPPKRIFYIPLAQQEIPVHKMKVFFGIIAQLRPLKLRK